MAEIQLVSGTVGVRRAWEDLIRALTTLRAEGVLVNVWDTKITDVHDPTGTFPESAKKPHQPFRKVPK